ncbi:MAG: GNAT family N-acetyltransferase [Candidatus Lokiarchaeota archaeon]|nr:GNAT family N-acetyltransferase [Candidatus Lokiarchaeota archaeon]
MKNYNYRIYLRAFEFDDLLLLNKWRNDDEIYKFTGGNKYFISTEYDKKWIEKKIFNKQSNIYLAICLKENNDLIGYLSIINIDYRNRKAEWGGIIIGEKAMQNKGLATEAGHLMLKYIFEEINLNRFYGFWLDNNKASLKMAEKLGFKREGLLRSSVYKLNSYHDQVIMSILKEEYNCTL